MLRKKIFSVWLILTLIMTMVEPALTAAAEDVSQSYKTTAVLMFSDSAISETTAGDGYTIDGTALTITATGTYRICGSCSDGSIIVNKSLNNVTLILDNLTLASSSTAPVVIKKSSTVNIHLEGTTTLTDNEDPENENSSDVAVSEAFEGAVVKVKSGSRVTFCGDGSLNVVANAKNGIKGGATAELIFNQSGTITVSGNGKYYGGTYSNAAVNNGIACDGSIVFNQGIYIIKAANDAIKSAPDATDTTEGTTIDTASAGAITINGGTFDIDADGDGIQADTTLDINGGIFDIQTWKGYGVWNDTLADEYSCKGLKASGDRAEEAGYEPTITITGGTFNINTGDDAVHSDAYITVTAGVFTIWTGDDGMHADTSLVVGCDGGNERDPDITVNSSYEGLEGGTVYMYSGRCNIEASDDGVNAAGGSSSGTDPGAGGGNSFNPGGGPSGGPGGGNGFNPGGGPGGETSGDGGFGGSAAESSSGDYNIYIYGGDLYVNCSGDGLDSNGGLYLYGGQQAVFSQAVGGDNSAIDADGTVLIQGAAIFTAGTTGMDGAANNSWFGSNQKYSANSSSYSANTVLNTKTGNNGSTLFSYKLNKSVNYVMASWPDSVSGSTPSFATATGVTECKGGSWSHTWNAGTVTNPATSTSTGILTYTCSKCGANEIQTIPMTVEIEACDHSTETGEIEETDEGYNVSFAGDTGVSSIVVYETQDYSGACETISANGTSVSRNSDSGAPDSSGSGQINFTVVLADGYALSSITVTAGTYKNIKGPADTGLSNTYRITKITADTIVTITTVECEHKTILTGTTPEWTWSSDFGTATLSYTCADCGNVVDIVGMVTSEMTSASMITFTSKAVIGETIYTDTKTAQPFTVTFAVSDGVTVDIYYTQDTGSADESAVTSGVARDSDSGCPVITGDGQINFTIVPSDGYTFAGLTAANLSGSYKNLKDVSTTEQPYTYRITKIQSDVTVTITADESNTFIVSYYDGDTLINEETYENNQSVQLFPELKKDGYVFAGWYTENVVLNSVSSINNAASKAAKTESISNNTALYAGWIAIDSQNKSFELLGAQIRTTEPTGLRFITKIGRELISDIEALANDNVSLKPDSKADKGVGFGTVVTKASLVQSAQIEKDVNAVSVNKGMAVCPAVNIYEETDDYYLYTAVVTGIKEGNYQTDIAVRPYITYKDANGFERTYYYTENGTNVGGGYSINIYTAAKAFYANSDVSDAVKEWLDNNIIKVVEG